VGPTTETSKGNRYILTFQDDLTKFVVAEPIKAREFVRSVILRFGAPEVVLSDQGSNFLSELFRNTCKLLRIKKINTTAFHPESNGGLERGHRVLVEYLRHYVAEDQKDWDDWVPYATFVYNTTTHRATGYTPFELLFGHRARVPTSLHERPTPRYNYDDYVSELKSRMQTAHAVARDRLVEGKVRSKRDYDKGTVQLTLKVGDRVLLFDENVRRGRSKKLGAKWIGPYVVLAVEGVNATIKRGRDTVKVHINRLKPFY